MNLDHIHDLIDRVLAFERTAYGAQPDPREVDLALILKDLTEAVQTLSVNQAALTQQVHLLLQEQVHLLERKR